MKKITLLLLAMLVSIAASAAIGDTFSVENVNYRVMSNTTSTDFATVIAIGLSDKGKAATSLALTIPSTVSYSGTTYAVTSVASLAFSGQTNIASVNLKYGIGTIENRAFLNCSKVTYVRMASSIKTIAYDAFAGCSALKSVYMANPYPNPRTTFYENDAFPSNSDMTLYLPKVNPNVIDEYSKIKAFQKFSSKKAGDYAYDVYCNDGALLLVLVPPTRTTAGEMTMIGFNVDGGKVVDGTFVPSCGSSTYSFDGYNYKLVSVCDNACTDLATLKKVDFSTSTHLTYIGDNAFKGCTNLTTVILGTSTLKKICPNAFNGTPITSITLPAGVTDCALSFVDNCKNLITINVNEANTAYSSCNGMLFSKSGQILYRCPEGKLGVMYDSYFASDVTQINDYAFHNCAKLTDVRIPFGVKTLGAAAFMGCTGLSIAQVPGSVTAWGENVFHSCTSLGTLYVNIKKPLTIATTEFTKAKKLILYVPNGATQDYKNASGWNTWGTVKHGSYDLGTYAHATGITDSGTSFTLAGTGYSITSTKPEVINGKQYDGRAMLTHQNNTPAGKLDKITIPASVTDSHNNKVYAVTAIGTDVMSDGITSDGMTLTLGENVDTVCVQAFQDVLKLTKLELNANLTTIEQNAFSNCNIANEIDLPYGLKKLGYYAFSNNPIKHLLVPASVTALNSGALAQLTKLEELVLNSPTWANHESWSLTNVPATCKLYVPTGCVLQYKNNKQFGKLNVMAGAYDFTAGGASMSNSRYFISVISNNSVISDGVLMGKAKYVYNPNIAASRMSTYACDKYETNKTNRANTKYLMTELGDSLLYNCSTISEVDISGMEKLSRIGDYALAGSGITSFTTPNTLTYIGLKAFVGCKNLSELFITQPTNNYSWAGHFYGDNASDFTCYVKWTSLPDWQKSVTNWTRYNNVNPLDQLNGYVQLSTDNKAMAIAVNHPVDWTASGLNAYVVSKYDPATQTVTTGTAGKSSANKGVLVTDYVKDQIYKLQRPTGTVYNKTNLLVGAADAAVNVYQQPGGYLFDGAKKYFWKPTGTYNLTRGYAYLKLDEAVAGSTSRVYVDLWPNTPDFKKGDVDGNGVVDITDANILINIVLGKDTASKYDGRADVTGEGTIDVSDINAVLNIILGK